MPTRGKEERMYQGSEWMDVDPTTRKHRKPPKKKLCGVCKEMVNETSLGEHAWSILCKNAKRDKELTALGYYRTRSGWTSILDAIGIQPIKTGFNWVEPWVGIVFDSMHVAIANPIRIPRESVLLKVSTNPVLQTLLTKMVYNQTYRGKTFPAVSIHLLILAFDIDVLVAVALDNGRDVQMNPDAFIRWFKRLIDQLTNRADIFTFDECVLLEGHIARAMEYAALFEERKGPGPRRTNMMICIRRLDKQLREILGGLKNAREERTRTELSG